MTSLTRPRLFRLTLIPGLAGIGWNLFGVVQFVSALQATPQSLMAQGMTAEQAAVMTGYPMWMTLAFGIGTLGGLLGSVLLTLGRPAQAVLAVSLAAYVALWIGDWVHGVFAALGAPQVVVLTLVVAIAAGLWALAQSKTLPQS